MKSRHCASEWLLIQHIHTGRQELEQPPSSTARRIGLAFKMKLFQIWELTSSGCNGDADMHIPKPAPKRCASMRIPAHQSRTEVFELSGSCCWYRGSIHTTPISSLQRRINIHKAYLDGLRRLAFNLMWYAGGLVHLGTPTQTVLLSKWDKTAERQRSEASPVYNSAAWDDQGFRSLFGVRLKRATASDSYCMSLAQRSALGMCTSDRWWLVFRGDRRNFRKGWPGDSENSGRREGMSVPTLPHARDKDVQSH